jgi:hypothetical protein
VRSAGPEPLAIGTAAVIVAFLGYVLVAQLEYAMLAAFLVVVGLILAMSTYLIARTHSNFLAVGRAYRWSLWIPPVSWFAASAALLRLAAGGAPGVPLAAGCAAVVGAILLAQHRELRLAAGSRRGAEFFVSLAIFVSAFGLFGVLYDLRAPGPLTGLAAGAIAGLLAAVPLRRAMAEDGRTAVYCGTAGLIVGQAAWALTYWSTAAIVAGAFLLLLLYVLVGLGEAILDRSFGRRVLLEYGLVGACGLVLIVGIGPWQG